MRFQVLLLIFFSLLFLASCGSESDRFSAHFNSRSYQKFKELDYQKEVASDSMSIQPYVYNPRYWQYKGEPILLLGASDEDNLFNHPDIWPFGLESHLNLMVNSGGNYVRNTMSSRDPGNLWPFPKDESGLFNLDTWNKEYWQRFEKFLDLTFQRDIIVQIEVWDRFDYAQEHWQINPFNPKNNINYSATASGLPLQVASHAGARENPFLRTPPEFENNTLVLRYQEALIAKLLSISLAYPNVLYCISNETNESPYWSDYWAYFIYQQALRRGVRVNVTEMWDSWDVMNREHDGTYTKPDFYSFVDISQNNHQQGQINWDNAQRVRSEKLNETPRPMNSVKIYGATTHGGNFEEGVRKFWRNIFGGFASSRFHRTGPRFNPYGLGLSPLAQKQLKSMRMITDEYNFFVAEPANNLLSERESDEAYASADRGRQYAVYFTDGGSVRINIAELKRPATLLWLDIMNSKWRKPVPIEATEQVKLTPPSKGAWAVVIK